MRYFMDTEFNGLGGGLMSIALVHRDVNKPPFYKVVEISEAIDPWVAEHVVPHLRKKPEPVALVAEALSEYLSTDVNASIVADWPSDFEHLMRLLITGPGTMIMVPDVTMEFVRLPGFNTADHSALPHNALADAEALRAYCVESLGM